jgi:hypothetical protein
MCCVHPSTPIHTPPYSSIPPSYEELFLQSKFCVAPYGHGWGLRLPIAMFFGCIPVIMQVRTMCGWGTRDSLDVSYHYTVIMRYCG